IHQHAVELLAVAESLLRDAALAQVAGHLGEAAQHTGFVAYRRDHHVRPEPAAVLPDAPALVLEPALCFRHFQFVIRPAGVLGRLWIERGEMLTDNLRTAVPFHTPRPLVPTGYMPRGVEQEDGIVLDALHQEAEKFVRRG